MGRKATKAGNNIYYLAREEAMADNPVFSSREKASEIIGMDRTRLARIELSEITPYPEEVKRMAEVYGMPELCYQYCSGVCPIGGTTHKRVGLDNLDRLVLTTLGALNRITSLEDSLIDITADGIVDEMELEEFERILEALSDISEKAQALELWAQKNLKRK